MKRMNIILLLSNIFLLLLCVSFGLQAQNATMKNAEYYAAISLIAEFHHSVYEKDWDTYIQKIEEFSSDNPCIERLYLSEWKKFALSDNYS